MTEVLERLIIREKEVIPLYEKISEWFDLTRERNLGEQKYLEIVTNLLPLHGTILDLGCGSGEPIAQFFIERSFKVTGVDGANRMIEKCKERFPQDEWIISDMRYLNLSKNFDAIIAWDSFFHLSPEAQRQMFKLFNKHLSNGGCLLFNSGHSYGEVYGEMNGYQLYHASLDAKEYTTLLKQYGFHIIINKNLDSECGMRSVWVAQKIKELNLT